MEGLIIDHWNGETQSLPKRQKFRGSSVLQRNLDVSRYTSGCRKLGSDGDSLSCYPCFYLLVSIMYSNFPRSLRTHLLSKIAGRAVIVHELTSKDAFAVKTILRNIYTISLSPKVCYKISCLLFLLLATLLRILRTFVEISSACKGF